MKLLRHLVAADLRRFGWLIAAWITLVAAGVVAYAWLPAVAGGGRISEGLWMTSGVLWLARQVYRLVVIVLIVHADPTVGSTAFWMTRPIPPRLLLASKALLIGAVTVGAPVAGDLALAVAYSAPIGDMMMSALQTALVNGFWVALCMTVAIVTRSLAQVALVSGVAASALVLVPLVVELLVSSRRSSAAVRSDLAFSPAMAVLAAVVFVVCLAVAWFVQYTRRRRPETIAVGVGGVCLSVALVMVTPPSFMMPEIESPQWARGAVLHLASPTPYVDREKSIEGEPYAVIRALLTLPALPPGWAAHAALRDATVQTESASVGSHGAALVQGAALSRDGQDDDHLRVALVQALGVDRVLGAFYGLDPAILFVAPGDGASLTALRGRYRGRFQVGFTHVEAAGIIPLVRGAIFQDGAYRVAIRDVRLDGVLTVLVQLSDVTRLTSRRGHRGYDVYLRNRTEREAIAGTRRAAREYSVIPGAMTVAEFSTVAPGVWTSAEYLTYRGGPGMSIPGWDLTPEWVNRAELVVVRVTSAGTIDAPLEIDNFTVASSRMSSIGTRQRF